MGDGGFQTMGAEVHGGPEDSWLVANAADKNAVFYCNYPDGNPEHDSTSTGRAIASRGVMITGDGTNGNAAIIRGYLWGENSKMTDDYYLTAGQVHPLRFKVIYAQGTTARGIKFFG